jgi:hypothetical protein
MNQFSIVLFDFSQILIIVIDELVPKSDRNQIDIVLFELEKNKIKSDFLIFSHG